MPSFLRRLPAIALAGTLGFSLAHAADPTGIEQHAFDSLVGQTPDLTAADLLAKLPSRAYRDRIDFDPKDAARYALIKKGLAPFFTPAADAHLSRNGFTAIPASQRFSMGSLYSYLYMKDLPVLVTTDSIIHAMHSAYDDVLKELEAQVFKTVIFKSLLDARDALAAAHPTLQGDAQVAVKDAELHLVIALNLMRGAGGPSTGWQGWDGKIKVVSRLGNDAAALEVLQKVAKGEADREPTTALHGGHRVVDWSQMRPRGHYTDSPDLQQYFRGMMWLGRSDTGLNLLTNPAGSRVDVNRERRAAGAVTLALDAVGGVDAISEVAKMIDFLVGPDDSLGLTALRASLERAKIKTFKDLADTQRDADLKTELLATGAAAQRIRSQHIVSYPGDPKIVPPPALFQVFGQRFVLDSFVLSRVVYDSIKFKGEKVRRMLPKGLDVWAALGNDEAARLLEPELKRLPYGSQLWAARQLVNAYPQQTWNTTLYGIWLDALRELDEAPGANAPQAMQTRAWQHKMLRTQLGSWAELRHDTVLYAKQSYTAMLGCDYPAAFVEPYPEFYRKVGRFGRTAAKLIANAKLSVKGRDELPVLLQRQANFFKNFEAIMGKLEALARKELASEPFTDAERDWLKKTIDKRGGGSGPPEYTGWYTELFYTTQPDDWAPTVADVHTDPNGGQILEVGVGDAQFLVVAVDNDSDKGVFVGPTYSYYEFTSPVRLTDPEWEERIRDEKLPPAPAWSRSFLAE